MSKATKDDQLSKPITFTITLFVIAILLLPIPGVDVIYDIAAICLAGSRWLKYAAAAKEIANNIRPEQQTPNAVNLFNAGLVALKASRYDEALRLFTASAEAGDHDAMNSIGAIYQEGRGRAVDYSLAAHWYEKAIAHGEHKHAPGNIATIGLAYSDGKNVLKNDIEAARLWRISAGTGCQQGQFFLGLSYRFGLGVPRDKSLARHWYGLAAAQGSKTAADELRKMDAEQPGEERSEQGQNADNGNGRMTRAIALELLELNEGASKAEMKRAYVRLMQNVHPDKGGSNFFAKQLNEAREVLGF